VFTWLADNSASEAFVDTVKSQSDADLPHALVRYMFEGFENLCIAPTWWDGLSGEVREGLVTRLNNATHIGEELNVRGLLDDGVRAVTWQVVGRRDIRG
jgi:hypothetical protein